MSAHDWNRGNGHRNLENYFKEDPTVLTDYYKWCFVRNPWDRVVSAHVRCTGAIQPIDPKWNDFGTWLRAWYKYKSVIKNRDTLEWQHVHHLPMLAHEQMPEFIGSMKVHFFPQLPLLKINGEIKMDFVGRFESMEKDFQHVCNKLGVTGNLKHHNARNRANNFGYDGPNATQCTGNRKNPIPYQEYYTDELIEIVADLYEEDIVEFGYEFERL